MEENLPNAIQIETEELNPVNAIPINYDLSPEIIASQINKNTNKCESYKYCIVVPFGIICIILIVYYAINH
jgi:hypothetical protein